MKTGSPEHFRSLVETAIFGARRGIVRGLGGLDGTKASWVHEAQQALEAYARSLTSDALETDVPQEQGWPKQCGCKRTFTQEQWRCLQLVGYCGAFKALGERYAVELRNCICASTIGIEVKLPMATPVPTGAENAQAAMEMVLAARMDEEPDHDKRCCIPAPHTRRPCEPWPF